ncbi:hypothetical protein ZEAMMB73_Zm00001d015171 [Zea mays]|uniref:Uncharacterized protein n=1 Tax=Zea mays TaxID=4577 RepID=A0A1D6GZQ0_MAIZE|nr:hypothetical protein ZEAMMB73_Zm00001d015171 [Zea mays]
MDDPHERAVCLEKDDTMARAHLLAANDGATEGMSPDVATAPKSKGCLMIGEYNKVAKKMSTEPVELLEFDPIELLFPFELNKQISCTLPLTNNTNKQVAFKIVDEANTKLMRDYVVERSGSNRYLGGPLPAAIGKLLKLEYL